MTLARRMVWWPNMASDVEAFIRTCPVCQRVKAEHGPPAGLLYPLPVPSRRGGTVGLDFLDMPTSASGHDFLQVHINCLTARLARPYSQDGNGDDCSLELCGIRISGRWPSRCLGLESEYSPPLYFGILDDSACCPRHYSGLWVAAPS